MIPLNELGAAYHERPSQKIRALLLQKPEQGRDVYRSDRREEGC